LTFAILFRRCPAGPARLTVPGGFISAGTADFRTAPLSTNDSGILRPVPILSGRAIRFSSAAAHSSPLKSYGLPLCLSRPFFAKKQYKTLLLTDNNSAVKSINDFS